MKRSAWATGAAALLLGATALAAPLVCPHDTPKSGEWRVVRGYGVGPTQGQAFEEAQKNARASLQQQVGGAIDDMGRDLMIAGLNFTIYPGEYDPTTGEACVLGIVKDENLGQSVRGHVAALEASLDTLTAALKGRLKSADRLRVEVPLWAGAWTSGEPARDLRNHLMGRLVGTPLTDHKPTRVLTGEVTAAGAECRWVPLLHDPRAKAQEALGEVRFNPLALGLTSCQAPPAAGGHALPTARTGSGGLRVTLTTSQPTITPCGGEPFQAEISTNQPARVRLYSVASDGKVLLDLPEVHLAADTPFSVTTPENPLRHVLLAPGVVSGLYAVALPESQAFPALGADGAGCLSTAGWDPHRRLPEAAAVDGKAVMVRAPHEAGCPKDPEIQGWHNRLLAAVKSLPRCGP